MKINTTSEKPLVSVVVVTYNSSKYILETLESAKALTYQNIELIVTDDHSTDNTVELINKWIEENGNKFVRTKLITSFANTGIASNCNRGLNEANGVWIKFIAGDDLLISDGINKLIDFQYKYNNPSIIHGRVIYINSVGEEIQTTCAPQKIIYPTFDEEFRSNKIYAPSVLFSKDALTKVGGFNQKFKIEDIQIYLKILNNGMLIYYIDEIIAKYRIHDNNISSNHWRMLEEHLNILNEYKSNQSYFINSYIFCRNVVINMLSNKLYSAKKMKLLVNHNASIMLIIFDFYFWFKIIKIILKREIFKK